MRDSNEPSETPTAATGLGQAANVEIGVDGLVVEGRRSLRPLCWTSHYKGKKPLLEYSRYEGNCATSESTRCDETFIHAAQDSFLDYEVITMFCPPQTDMKWWQTSSMMVKEELGEGYITDQALRAAVFDAVADFRTACGELSALMKYAQREPYDLNCSLVGESADHSYLNLSSRRIASFDRADLEAVCWDLNFQLRHVAREAEALKERIVMKKADLAEEGDDGELVNLYEQGYCSEVYAVCKARHDAQEGGGIRIA
ncbi:hypothetical protein Tdes44962_MAKER01055 [Teratosphaeria destructans]|uniref:Uncharacterized protein n=1 Tax=Teratosphaeria destructans TaxID=418781 RepID=A0A9W7VYA2_9PEZI|nr:hypothetical protein Tdes44962_MAKER01055 [Teratosphaeria destructans]